MKIVGYVNGRGDLPTISNEDDVYIVQNELYIRHNGNWVAVGIAGPEGDPGEDGEDGWELYTLRYRGIIFEIRLPVDVSEILDNKKGISEDDLLLVKMVRPQVFEGIRAEWEKCRNKQQLG